MTALEAVGYFIAAVRAVAPDALERSADADAVGELPDWIAGGHPVGQIVGNLSDAERADVRAVLNRMLREMELRGVSAG